jgi:pimeloyl-ACP methyl ester carboxylesterase
MKVRLKTGIAVNYEAAGDGVPLVFIHGIGANLRFWDAAFHAFANTHRVLRYDICGFGETDHAADAEYTIPLLAQDAYALMTELRITGPVIVGYGLGALIALEVAMRRPGYPRAIVLVSPSLPHKEVREQLLDRLGSADTAAAAEVLIGAELSRGFLAARPDAVDEYRQLIGASDSDQFRAALEALPVSRVPWGAHLVRCATLVMAGEADPGSDSIRSLQASIPGAAFALLPSGSALPIEAATEFEATLSKFLVTAA